MNQSQQNLAILNVQSHFSTPNDIRIFLTYRILGEKILLPTYSIIINLTKTMISKNRNCLRRYQRIFWGWKFGCKILSNFIYHTTKFNSCYTLINNMVVFQWFWLQPVINHHWEVLQDEKLSVLELNLTSNWYFCQLKSGCAK